MLDALRPTPQNYRSLDADDAAEATSTQSLCLPRWVHSSKLFPPFYRESAVTLNRQHPSLRLRGNGAEGKEQERERGKKGLVCVTVRDPIDARYYLNIISILSS